MEKTKTRRNLVTRSTSKQFLAQVVSLSFGRRIIARENWYWSSEMPRYVEKFSHFQVREMSFKVHIHEKIKQCAFKREKMSSINPCSSRQRKNVFYSSMFFQTIFLNFSFNPSSSFSLYVQFLQNILFLKSVSMNSRI